MIKKTKIEDWIKAEGDFTEADVRVTEFAAKIASAVMECFNNEGSEIFIDEEELKDEGIFTELIYALGVVAPLLVFEKLTSKKDMTFMNFNQEMNALIMIMQVERKLELYKMEQKKKVKPKTKK